MLLRKYQFPYRSGKLIIASLILMAAGLLYYATYRWHGSLLGESWWWLQAGNAPPADWTAGTFPSFVHTLSLSLLSFGLLGFYRGIRLSAGLLAMTMIAEMSIGTVDPNDLYAASIGLLVGCLLARLYLPKNSSPVSLTEKHSVYNNLVAAGLIVCSAIFIGGSYTDVGCFDCGGYNDYNAKPVYMDYNTLRTSVAVEDPREIENVKRVYLYRGYIFLNRRNEGIHVIDNADPANPINFKFISIPGNTELAIRNNYLYADSYVDLITLDLNDPLNVREINRQRDIFPWDAYQNVPDNIYFDFGLIDVNRGVVVSYEN